MRHLLAGTEMGRRGQPGPSTTIQAIANRPRMTTQRHDHDPDRRSGSRIRRHPLICASAPAVTGGAAGLLPISVGGGAWTLAPGMEFDPGSEERSDPDGEPDQIDGGRWPRMRCRRAERQAR